MLTIFCRRLLPALPFALSGAAFADCPLIYRIASCNKNVVSKAAIR